MLNLTINHNAIPGFNLEKEGISIYKEFRNYDLKHNYIAVNMTIAISTYL
jgi:hypothetical protein